MSRADRITVLTAAALVAVTFGTSTCSTNARIDDMNARITSVDERSERRDAALRATMNTLQVTVDSIARDVAFMAGRQAERDANQ